MIHTQVFYWTVMLSPLLLILVGAIIGTVISRDNSDLDMRVTMIFVFYWFISFCLVVSTLFVHLITKQDGQLINAYWTFIWTSSPAITFWVCSVIAAVISALTCDDTEDIPEMAVRILGVLLFVTLVGWLIYTLLVSVAGVITAQ